MRVLFIHRYCGLGGVTVVMRKRCQGLDKLRVHTDFLFLQDNGGREIFDGLPIRLYHTRNIREAETILKEGHYEVISTIDCPEIHEVLEALQGKISIVCEVRTSYPEHRKYFREGKLPANAECIVTPSKRFRRLLEEEMSAFNRRIPIYVIPNQIEDIFLDVQGFGSCHYPKKAIGWVGRMDDTKNFEELFEIAAYFSEIRTDIEFFIVGRFPSDESRLCYKAVSHFKGRVNFVWLPFLDHRKMPFFYAFLRNSGGCLLSTSRGEVFPNVVLESMASRCPVIATDIEVMNELLDDGKCGALYQTGNLESAVENIIKVIDDESYRAKITAAAYAKVRDNFTSDKVSAEWKMLFDSVLA